MKKKDIIKKDLLELVFENRNKSYGAYYLRRHEVRYTLRGLLIACGALLMGLFMPILISYFSSGPSLKDDELVNVPVDQKPLPQGLLTVEYVKPPPPRSHIMEVPKVTKDPVVEKKVDEKKIDVADNTSHDKYNKDTTIKTGTGSKDGDTSQTFLICDQLPTLTTKEYKSIAEYIKKNTVYPESEKIIGRHSGRIVVTTIVNRDGTLANVYVSHHLCQELESEAMRVVKAMPLLNPARTNGKAIKLVYNIPFDFNLNESKSTSSK